MVRAPGLQLLVSLFGENIWGVIMVSHRRCLGLFLLFFLLNSGCGGGKGGGDLKSKNNNANFKDSYDFGDADDADGESYGGGYGNFVDDGEGANGQVSQEEIANLRNLLGALSAGDQNQAKNLILAGIDNCNFLGKPNPQAEQQCKAGNEAACAQQMMNYGSNFFSSGLQNMKVQGKDVGQIIYMLKDDCQKIDVSNPQKALSEMEKLRQKCTKGEFMSCIMLLFYSIKLMLSAILKAVMGGMGAGI